MKLNWGVFEVRRFDAIDESVDNNVDTSRESDRTEETPVTEASTTEFNRNPEPTTESPTVHGITYEGDYESVDDHKKHDDKHGIPRIYENTSELCTGNYDTISVIRRELYVFKNTVLHFTYFQELFMFVKFMIQYISSDYLEVST